MVGEKNLFEKKGVFLVAPSGYVDPEDVYLAERRLNLLGFGSVYHTEHIFERYYDYAGSLKRRARELNNAYSSDPEIIMSVLGGMGAVQILPLLDFDMIRDSGKVLVGFSDVTILLNAIYQRTGARCIHGPHFGKKIEPSSVSADCLIKAINKKDYEVSFVKEDILNDGDAFAEIVGGSIELLGRSLGTPYEIDTNGKIVFLEDYLMKSWRVLEILWQLKLAGKFDNLKGVILGHFTQCGENMGVYLRDFFEGFDCPVITNQPIGHSEPNVSVPIGEKCFIDCSQMKWGIKFSK